MVQIQTLLQNPIPCSNRPLVRTVVDHQKPASTTNRWSTALGAWVDSLLQQLSSVTDMDAARAKATATLSALVASTTAPEAARLRSQLVEAGKENTILKRAVAIQANRLQELGSKDAEVCVFAFTQANNDTNS